MRSYVQEGRQFLGKIPRDRATDERFSGGQQRAVAGEPGRRAGPQAIGSEMGDLAKSVETAAMRVAGQVIEFFEFSEDGEFRILQFFYGAKTTIRYRYVEHGWMRKVLSYLAAAMLTGIAPIAVFGHSYGPATRVTGAPGDNARACTQCHATSALNSGTGSVKILLQSGAFYIPGVKQRVAVQVADAVQQRWGFELTARLNSDLEKSQAGDFNPVDNMTQVICDDSAPKPCASGPSYIQQTAAGTRNGTKGSVTFQFDWTPPATNAGPVTFYVAGNAADGNGTNTGDFIYTSSVQLAPAIPVAPSVTAGNIVSAATSAVGTVAPNSWVTIYGSNLSATTRGWADSDFVNGGMPFSLDGVSVLLNVNNTPRVAYVGYVSPTQVNFLLPTNASAGTTNVQVKNPAGISTAAPITVAANAPQLFTLDGKNVMGIHANGNLVGKASPAAPGETIVVYGTGLGAAAPALVPGQVPADALPLAALPQVTIGGAAATVSFAGVVAGAAGVYQINVQVPTTAANGDLPLIVTVGTASSASTVITIQK